MESDIDIALGEKLNQLKMARRAKLGLLTRRKNEIIKLMENICNVDLVKSKMEMEFSKPCTEMQELNESVKALLSAEDAEKE